MRNRVLALFAVVCLVGLVACSGGSGDKAPVFKFENLAVPQQVVAGEPVEILCIERDVDGPNGKATSAMFADMDGDLTTLADQVEVTPEHPCDYGAHQKHEWDTEGVPAGEYWVVSVLKDDKFVVETTAVGQISVFEFVITKPEVDRAALEGGTIDISYQCVDPDSKPTIDVFADRDGDLLTDADQYLIAEDRVATGVPETVEWLLDGVNPGSYHIMFLVDDGVQGTEEFMAPGHITVVTVTAFAPADGAELLSTAYNARLTFSESLEGLGAFIDAGTIRVRSEDAVIPGTYTLEANGREINFEPSAGVFPATSEIRIEVWTDLLYTDEIEKISEFVEFKTGLSPVFVAGRGDAGIAVVSVDDPENPQQVDFYQLEEGDEPYFTVCASDGMLYMSNRKKEPFGSVIVYDVVNQERVGLIELPPMFVGDEEENPVGTAGLVLSPDGKTLYVAGWEEVEFKGWMGEHAHRTFLSVIDRATMTETKRIHLSAIGEPRGVAVSPDGTRVYVANPFAGDYGALDWGWGWNGDGGWDGPIMFDPPVFGMIHVISTETNTEIDTDGVEGNGISAIIPDTPFVVSVAVSADGKTLYAGHGGAGAEFTNPTTNISTFNTTTFIEGNPLFSLAGGEWYTSSAANLLFDPHRGLLYAPRLHPGEEGGHGLSIFETWIPRETIVFTGAVQGGSSSMRDVDLLWGTRFIVLANAGSGVVLVDVDQFEATASAGMEFSVRDIATIPPSRH
ncbi:MAG: YncE family protein [Planctomycetota bacterium]|jgi:hypothetical protein